VLKNILEFNYIIIVESFDKIWLVWVIDLILGHNSEATGCILVWPDVSDNHSLPSMRVFQLGDYDHDANPRSGILPVQLWLFRNRHRYGVWHM